MAHEPLLSRTRAVIEVLVVSTKLGLTSFGGPIAHLGYFHEEYVLAILAPADFALAAILFAMLTFWELPPWLVVLAGALGGSIL
jgi:chromate transport protein ChrA